MRVVFLTAAGPWSGAEVHTMHLAHALKEKGHDVAIVELGRRRYELAQSLSCPVLHVDLGPSPPEGVRLDALGLRSWMRHFRSIEADVAILVKGNFQLGSLALEAAARLRFRRYLVIEHLHAPLSNRVAGRHMRGLVPGLGLWWYRQKLSGYLRSVFPQRVICVSHAVATTLQEDYGYPPRKVVAAHCGVDTDLFMPSPHKRAVARKSWGVPETAFVFGTLGRLSPMKNHGQLINAFSQLCTSSGGRDIRLVIVGDGPLGASLQSLADSSGVSDRIVFGGFSETPQNIYPAFDVFCFPSTTGESFGIALIEAMSCGCPPIAADIGGVTEIVNDSCQGWIIRSGDEKSLFSAMVNALELDMETLQQLGTNARGRIMADFNAVDRWKELAKVIESEYPGSTNRDLGASGESRTLPLKAADRHLGQDIKITDRETT